MRHLRARRATLCAPVRTRAGARRANWQSRLHRRRPTIRRRSKPCRGLVSATPAAGRRDDPRLAFRPPAGGAHAARAREVLTELVPGLLQAFASSGDPDSGARGFRRRARAHAGGGRTVLALKIQSAHLRVLRRHPRRRAAACPHGDQRIRIARRDDRPARPRIAASDESGFRRARPAGCWTAHGILRNFSMRCAISPGRKLFRSASSSLSGAIAPAAGGTRLFGAGGERRQGGAGLRRTRFRRRAWARSRRPLRSSLASASSARAR